MVICEIQSYWALEQRFIEFSHCVIIQKQNLPNMKQRASNTLYGIETLHQIQNCTKHENVSDTETLYTNCRHFFTNTQFTPWSIPTTEQLYVGPNTE